MFAKFGPKLDNFELIWSEFAWIGPEFAMIGRFRPKVGKLGSDEPNLARIQIWPEFDQSRAEIGQSRSISQEPGIICL